MEHSPHFCQRCFEDALTVTDDIEAADWWDRYVGHDACNQAYCDSCNDTVYEMTVESLATYIACSRKAMPEEIADLYVEQAMATSMSAFNGGGVRSTDEGKPQFDLLLVSDLSYNDQIMTRAALRMAEGAVTYGPRNHEKMRDAEALERCKSSLVRHVMQYVNGETDEDHLAAVVCNAVMASGIEKRTPRGLPGATVGHGNAAAP